MSSKVDAGTVPTRSWASELQRYLAWSPALLGGVVALLGLILAGGGAYLAAGRKPVLRSRRRDACRGGLSSHQRKDRGILHLRRRVRLHGGLELLGSWPVGLAVDSASSRTLRPSHPGDSHRSPTRPDDGTGCAQVGLG